MRAVQRGLDARHEQNPLQLLRDTRTFGQRVGDFFKSPLAVCLTLVMMGVSAFVIPQLADLVFVLGMIAFLVAITRKTALPFRMPMHSKMKDNNDLDPGSSKARTARGIYFVGNELKTQHELWFSNEDMRTHMLIFGSTGSGKTESLVSLAYNSLLQGSGFIYVDGKGDNALFAKVFSMVRSMGREDDLLLINFMTGARDIIGPQKNRLSNTMNPFANGSSSMLSQLVVSLMDSSSESSDGDMWKGRAIAFVEAIMKILVAMRDAGHILLDANTIRNYFALDRIESMVLDKVFIRDDQDPVNIENLPPVVTEPIKNYLITLPGYNKEKKGKQVSQVLEQHGFITMQLVRVFSSLADTYGHIIRTKLAEVDLKDVVLNRRILVVLLPALEKSPDELSNLGKVVIASLRAMMAAGLGDAVEGEYRDLVLRKPTNAKTPYLCILDEYGYYAVEGFAVVPAQARSLGFSVVFAGQDLPAFQKASKEEAASIGANTNIKICMKLEDPLETWDFFMKTAGESYVTHVKEFQADSKTVLNRYMDNRSAQVEKRARVDLLDLKEQSAGEAHIFFKSKIIRARMFYANPEPVKVMRLNQFLKIDTPEDAVVVKLSKGFRHFEKLVQDGDIFVDIDLPHDELHRVLSVINEKQGQPPIERGVAALMAYQERQQEDPVEAEELAVLDDLPTDELNIFTHLRMTGHLQDVMKPVDMPKFSQPILHYMQTRDQVAYLERLGGRGEQSANNVANEIVKDMQNATHYPPMVLHKPTPADLANMVSELVTHVDLKKQELKEKTSID